MIAPEGTDRQMTAGELARPGKKAQRQITVSVKKALRYTPLFTDNGRRGRFRHAAL